MRYCSEQSTEGELKMKHNYFRIVAAVLLAILLVVSAINFAFAISTDKATEMIDVSRKCSLTLTYKNGDTKYKDLEIELYRIADVTADFQYTLVSELSDYPTELNKIRAQSEWDTICDTVGMYVSAGKIAALQKGTTDADGVVKFTDIVPGIVYVRWTGNKTDLNVEGFAPFLMEIPKLGEDGKWNYEIDALPKPGKDVPDREEITVTKLWKDEGHSDSRPAEITIQIYKNAELYEEVALNASNNWSYTWKTDVGFEWAVLEKSVPDKYTVSYDKGAGTVLITNVFEEEPEPPAPPTPTGDNSHVIFWAVMMAVSGILLLLLALLKRRNNEEQ